MTHTQPAADHLSPFVRPIDLAHLLQVSPETIYRRLADETIPGVKLGRLWLIPRATVAQLLTPYHN